MFLIELFTLLLAKLTNFSLLDIDFMAVNNMNYIYLINLYIQYVMLYILYIIYILMLNIL